LAEAGAGGGLLSARAAAAKAREAFSVLPGAKLAGGRDGRRKILAK